MKIFLFFLFFLSFLIGIVVRELIMFFFVILVGFMVFCRVWRFLYRIFLIIG